MKIRIQFLLVLIVMVSMPFISSAIQYVNNPEQKVKILVKDAKTGELLTGVKITLAEDQYTCYTNFNGEAYIPASKTSSFIVESIAYENIKHSIPSTTPSTLVIELKPL